MGVEPMSLHLGDCVEILPTLEKNSVDAVVTDPPYGLEFMGKKWDRIDTTRSRMTRQKEMSVESKRPFLAHSVSYQVGKPAQEWHNKWASVVFRVLKPGGYMLCFGGTRTYHRLACAVEDAGFEIRDCVMWLYGSGFPKGKGNLKPAYEPILVCRRPGPKVLPLGIDGCRVKCEEGSPSVQRRKNKAPGRSVGSTGWTTPARPASYNEQREGELFGRWPANVVHDGSDEVMEAFARFGEKTSGKPGKNGHVRNVRQPIGIYGNGAGLFHDQGPAGQLFGDTGTVARFFYAAKASRKERGFYCFDCDEAFHIKLQKQHKHGHKDKDGKQTWDHISSHPTVKPVALMEWLVKLVCPVDGVVLDPFLGSGSTGVACVRTGREIIGIELDPQYFKSAKRRIKVEMAKPKPLYL